MGWGSKPKPKQSKPYKRGFSKHLPKGSELPGGDTLLEKLAIMAVQEAKEHKGKPQNWEFKGKKNPEDPSRHGALWSADESLFLVECFYEGDDAETLAKKVERKVAATLAHLAKWGLLVKDDFSYTKFYRPDGTVFYDGQPPKNSMLFQNK